MKRRIVIYKITNPKNKIYIGQSVNFDKRVWEYINCGCKAQTMIFRSINKYGWGNHKLEILEEFEIRDHNILNEREIFFIALFKSNKYRYPDSGLNLTDGGAGTSGRTLTEEQRKRMSEIGKGRIVSEATRKKIGDLTRGKKRSEFSDEWKKNIGIASKGRKIPRSLEYRKNISLRMITVRKRMTEQGYSSRTEVYCHLETGIFYSGLSEVAEFLKVSTCTAGRYVRAKKIPILKVLTLDKNVTEENNGTSSENTGA